MSKSNCYEFFLVLDGVETCEDGQIAAERLFAVECKDSIFVRLFEDKSWALYLMREGENKSSVIHEAIKDVEQAGYSVKDVRYL